MAEEFKRSIDDFLTEDFRKKQQFKRDQEQIRQVLQAKAVEKISEYQREWKELKPQCSLSIWQYCYTMVERVYRVRNV